jgi:hypothetical protein
MVTGVQSNADNIKAHEEVLLVTPKGNPIAIATARMTSAVMATRNDGVVAETKRLIMPPGTYSKPRTTEDHGDIDPLAEAATGPAEQAREEAGEFTIE